LLSSELASGPDYTNEKNARIYGNNIYSRGLKQEY